MMRGNTRVPPRFVGVRPATRTPTRSWSDGVNADEAGPARRYFFAYQAFTPVCSFTASYTPISFG